MMSKEAMKLALEALEANQPINYCMNNNGEKFPMMQEDPFRFERNTKAITALREALAEQKSGIKQVIELYDSPDQPAQQEPVAWISEVRCVGPEYGKKRYGALPVQSLQPGYYAHTPLYTSPPAQHKPLTDEQIDRLWSQSLADTESETWLPLREFARAIEAAHAIKGDT